MICGGDVVGGSNGEVPEVGGGMVGGTVAGVAAPGSAVLAGVRPGSNWLVSGGGAVFAADELAAARSVKAPTPAAPPAAIQPVSRASRARPSSRAGTLGPRAGVEGGRLTVTAPSLPSTCKTAAAVR
jgi:hypothetical protein